MNFSEALEAVRVGDTRIARSGWNGKNMWVGYMPPVTIPEGVVNGRTKRLVPTGDLVVGGYLVMMTANGVWQPGWLASQADMLANDWEVVA
jgi:hypothetical protein